MKTTTNDDDNQKSLLKSETFKKTHHTHTRDNFCHESVIKVISFYLQNYFDSWNSLKTKTDTDNSVTENINKKKNPYQKQISPRNRLTYF